MAPVTNEFGQNTNRLKRQSVAAETPVDVAAGYTIAAFAAVIHFRASNATSAAIAIVSICANSAIGALKAAINFFAGSTVATTKSAINIFAGNFCCLDYG